MKAWLLAALVLLPTVAALDAFPTETRLGATEARFLVRLPDGGALRVSSDGAVEIALVAPGEEPFAFVPVNASFPVDAASVWHGLPGVVQIVARRADPAQAVTLDVDDGAGGVTLEWPAERALESTATPAAEPGIAAARWVPAPGALALAGVLVVATTVASAWQHSRSGRAKGK